MIVGWLGACATTPKPTIRPPAVHIVGWNIDRAPTSPECDAPSEAALDALRQYAATFQSDIILFQARLPSSDIEQIFPKQDYAVQTQTSTAGHCLLNGAETPVLLGLARPLKTPRHFTVTPLPFTEGGAEGMAFSVDADHGGPLHILFTALPMGCETGETGTPCKDLFMRGERMAHWAQAEAKGGRSFEIWGVMNRDFVTASIKDPIASDSFWDRFLPAVTEFSPAPNTGEACYRRMSTMFQTLVGDKADFSMLEAMHWRDQPLSENCAMMISTRLPPKG